MPDLVDEAAQLVALGVRELNLIAQDLTAYGRDLDEKSSLAGLLRELSQVDGIDWIRREGESYIIIGEHGLHGRGIASEAVRLRTQFAFRELNLHRVYNWIVYDNIGSRKANEKIGYREQGRIPGVFRRGLRRHDLWLGEILRSDWERDHRD